MTQYIVLCQSEDSQWEELGYEEARSATSAIRQFIDIADTPQSVTSRYAAVPSRSFRPVTVKVETKTALKFS